MTRGGGSAQRFFVSALADDHLPAAATPVAYASGEALQLYSDGGVALRPGGLHRGDAYTVWSYAPAAEAAGSWPGSARTIRTARVRALLRSGRRARACLRARPGASAALATLSRPTPRPAATGRLYRAARRVVGNAGRRTRRRSRSRPGSASSGGFVYDEQPPQAPGRRRSSTSSRTTQARLLPALRRRDGPDAALPRRSRRASRPASPAAAGTPPRSGWIVSDRNAHAWVEVWFPGYGWLPFDPTPSPGYARRPLLGRIRVV